MSRKSGNHNKQNSVRIIGGKHRSRKISFPDLEGLRPTGDRIRETLFNWLAPYLEGAVCLDLFAGSGALGLECLSRGALQVVLVDTSPVACDYIRRNIAALGETQAHVYCASAASWLQQHAMQFDIIFLDPPFALGLNEPIIQALSSHLKPGALIYVEADAAQPEYHLPVNWQMLKDKKAGEVRYQLYQSE